MNLRQYPLNSLRRHPGRTAGLVALVALLCVVVFGGSLVISSLRKGLDSLESRMGADIIVAPKSASTTHDLEAILLDGVPGYFYMDKSYVDKVAARDGVQAVSPQYFLTTVKAGCCSMPVQIIGIDPQTDFTIQPWIDHSYGHELGDGDVAVGANISGAVGSNILFYGVGCKIVAKLDETGTALDNAVFCNAQTIATLIQGSIDQNIAVLDDNDPAQVISTVQVKVADGYDITSVANDINLHVRGASAVRTKAMTSGVANSMSGISRVIGVLVAVVWVLAAAVLAVAYWVLGRQRAREFAVLRVLGVPSGSLARILVVESLATSAIGAVVGILCAGVVVFAFSGALESALGLPFLLPDGVVLLAYAGLTLLVALVVGVATSAVTAIRLAKTDAALVLREA